MKTGYADMKLNFDKILFVCLLAIPFSFILYLLNLNESVLFITAIMSLMPLAHYIGKATESISLLTNPMIGGFINATFGNFIELVIAVLSLKAGLFDVVKASLVGSIIANLLLLIGLSMFFGGLKYKEQIFNTHAAGVSSTMLLISVFGLSIPSIFSMAHNGAPQLLSEVVSIVLALIYVLGLVFAFVTHKHLFDPIDELLYHHIKPYYKLPKAIAILFVSLIVVFFESELLVGTIKQASISLGLSQAFIGFVIIAIVTNIAEKLAAIRMALKNDIDLAIEIGTSSAIQIALFVAPILVLYTHFLTISFDLIFPLFQLVIMFFAVIFVNYLSSDGKCNWLEGAQLITIYLLIAITFYF